MKRFLAIGLLLTLTAPALLSYCWLQYHKVQVRREVKHNLIAGIERIELVLLKFTPEQAARDLRWEHSREFEYRRQMYDVVEQITVGDTTYYWCWWDNDETRLNRRLNSLVQYALQTSQPHQQQQDQLLSFVKLQYCLPAASDFSLLVSNQLEVLPGWCSSGYFSYTKLPPTPPPRPLAGKAVRWLG